MCLYFIAKYWRESTIREALYIYEYIFFMAAVTSKIVRLKHKIIQPNFLDQREIILVIPIVTGIHTEYEVLDIFTQIWGICFL